VALNKLNHIYGEPLLVSSLNVEGNTVLDSSLTVLGNATFPSASIGAVSNEEIQYLDGLTGNIQTQLDGKITAAQVSASYAALSGATFTGAISATGLTLTNDLTIANGGTGLSATTKGGIFVGTSTSAFTNLTVGLDGYLLTADSAQASGVKWAAAPVSLPTQTGNNGKYLTTDGTSASWVTLNALPTQTGNNGKFLTTDGTTSSWATLTASNLSGGTLSSTILGNSTVYIGSTAVALNRATGNLALTGISSVALPGSTSGTITLQPAAVAGTNTITLPAATGTVDLVGNTFYVGTTAITNNRASASQTLSGVSIDGNAATATTASGVSAANISGTTLNSGVTASSLTSVGTITTGTWSASFGAVSGANLTSLTAGNLTGTIPSTVLGNSTHYIGTTAVTLNRASANLALTGISSVAFPGSTSGTTTLQASAAAGTTTVTLPAATGTVDLVGNTFYVGTTAIANNRASGAQTLTGVSIDGNAATATTASSVTNGLTTSNYSSYALPLTGGTMTGTITVAGPGNQMYLHPSTAATSGRTVIVRNDGSDFYFLLSDANTSPSTATWNTLRPFIINTTTGVFTSNNSQTFSGTTTVQGTLVINSDSRLKENLVPITGAVEKIKAITGYNYNRIGSEKLEMGVIAQEVQVIAPELIIENEEGTLAVAYANMVALLIEAVKEQSAEIAALKEQVKELKG